MQGKWMHSNWIRKKAKSIKCDNKKQQKNTQLPAPGRNVCPMGQGSTQQSVIRRGSANLPPPLSFYKPFLTEKVPLSYTFYWQMTPPLTDVDALFSADHEWIPKPGGIRASLAATKCICYLSLLIFRTLQYTSTGEIPTYSYLKPKQKKILLSSGSHGTSPYRSL